MLPLPISATALITAPEAIPATAPEATPRIVSTATATPTPNTVTPAVAAAATSTTTPTATSIVSPAATSSPTITTTVQTLIAGLGAGLELLKSIQPILSFASIFSFFSPVATSIRAIDTSVRGLIAGLSAGLEFLKRVQPTLSEEHLSSAERREPTTMTVPPTVGVTPADSAPVQNRQPVLATLANRVALTTRMNTETNGFPIPAATAATESSQREAAARTYAAGFQAIDPNAVEINRLLYLRATDDYARRAMESKLAAERANVERAKVYAKSVVQTFEAQHRTEATENHHFYGYYNGTDTHREACDTALEAALRAQGKVRIQYRLS